MSGIVHQVVRDTDTVQELLVRVPAWDDGLLRPAVSYPQLSGRAVAGDQVLLNTVAVELGLGTGGTDFVAAILNRIPAPAPVPGHILKLRYTPLQTPVLAAEAPESPYHAALQRFRTLNGAPVVCCELHSQVAAVCAGIRQSQGPAAAGIEPRCPPEQGAASAPAPQMPALAAGTPNGGARAKARVRAPAVTEAALPQRSLRAVLVYSEGAALPAALSRTIPILKQADLLSCVVTCGQAFGGDYEAVNLYSGLAIAAVAAGADVVITAPGPGSAGTGTALGFSGVEQGQAVNAAASLGGRAILVPRLSYAEPRPRHRGVSHHTLTVLERVVRADVQIAVPLLPARRLSRVVAALRAGRPGAGIQVVDASAALERLLLTPGGVDTMGRGVREDPAFFLAGCAAGLLAGNYARDSLETA